MLMLTYIRKIFIYILYTLLNITKYVFMICYILICICMLHHDIYEYVHVHHYMCKYGCTYLALPATTDGSDAQVVLEDLNDFQLFRACGSLVARQFIAERMTASYG